MARRNPWYIFVPCLSVESASRQLWPRQDSVRGENLFSYPSLRYVSRSRKSLQCHESESTFSTSHVHQSLKLGMPLPYSRRAWSTIIRQLRSQAHAFGDHTQAWRSIFKNVMDYYSGEIVLVVGSDVTTEFINILDAIREVIIPASKPCLLFQGESRNYLWPGACKNLLSASPATRRFCLVAASTVTMTPRMYIEDRHYYRWFFQGSEGFDFGGALSLSQCVMSWAVEVMRMYMVMARDVCCTTLLMATEAALVAQGKTSQAAPIDHQIFISTMPYHEHRYSISWPCLGPFFTVVYSSRVP